MKLTAVQEDALIELLNIGFGRAAASLSQLTGHRVLLEVPHVTIHPVDEVLESLERVIRTDVASVHQIFSGPVSGDALLILDQAGWHSTPKLKVPDNITLLFLPPRSPELNPVENVWQFNACLGTFGNLLQVQVAFSVPQLNLESLGAILESLRVNQEGVKYAMVVHAGFKLRDAEVRGYLVIVLSVASLDRLIRAVEDWEQRTH